MQSGQSVVASENRSSLKEAPAAVPVIREVGHHGMSGCRSDSAERLAAGGSSSAPCVVVQGAKLHAHPDWIRLVGPAEQLNRAKRLLEGMTGSVGEEAGGIWYYQRRMKFSGGAFVAFEDRNRQDHIAIEMPGSFLAGLGDLYAGPVRRLLETGWHCTRIDLAVDFMAEHEDECCGLIDAVMAACESGQLCGARRYEYSEARGSNGVDLRIAKIGRRGHKNGSGRFVRVYDKGLETGQYPAGVWERWEAEFTGDVGDQVARALFIEGGTGPSELAFSAVDFREVNGSASLARRPRADWWQEVIGCAVLVVRRAVRKSVSFDGWRRWMEKAVIPSVKAIAQAAGMEYQSLMDVLSEGVQASSSARRSVAAWQARVALAGVTGGGT